MRKRFPRSRHRHEKNTVMLGSPIRMKNIERILVTLFSKNDVFHRLMILRRTHERLGYFFEPGVFKMVLEFFRFVQPPVTLLDAKKRFIYSYQQRIHWPNPLI